MRPNVSRGRGQGRHVNYLFTWKEFPDNQIITEKRGIDSGFNIITEGQSVEQMERRQHQGPPSPVLPMVKRGFEAVVPNPKLKLVGDRSAKGAGTES